MQGSKTSSGGMRATRRAKHLPLLALSVLLAACHVPRADSTDAAQRHAANAITAIPPEPEQAPAAGVQAQAEASQHPDSGATQAHALIDADGNPYRPDDSYNRANLRAQYRECVAASGAGTHAVQACMDEEFRWQQERMRIAWAAIADGPDSEYKDKLADEQDAYMRDTARYCRFDPATQGQVQMLDALSCRINRYANRANVLEALIKQ